MDRIDAMGAFVAVAELRGFAPAAKRLKVSAPTVTRLVASLEQRLSVRLLHRTTRTVALTEEGARYLPRAKSILDAVRDAEAKTMAEHASPAGRFAVTAPLAFGRREVAPLFSDYLARYPAVTGELVLVDRVVNLIEEGLDLAVRIGELSDSALKVRALGSTRRVLVASPAYLNRAGKPRRPADLHGHSTMLVSGLTPHADWRFFRGRRTERIAVRPSFTTNNAEAAIEHALRGGGIAMVLSYQVADLVQTGKLEVLLKSFEPPPRPIQLVYPSGREPSANVRAFIDLAVATRSWEFARLI